MECIDRKSLVCAVLLSGYQASRALQMARDMTFSTAFLAAVSEHDELRVHRGTVRLTPATAETARLLQDTIGGYLGRVLKTTYSRSDIDGSVGVPYSQAKSVGELRLTCEYVGGRVLLRESTTR